jgi:exonuclease SbcC
VKLKLSNFKQHSSYEVEFPDKGMVLVKGETGRGKTTIFEAIYFAITGEADDIVPWCGDKPVVVEFEFNTIQITRSHSPDNIECTVEELPHDFSNYRGEAAQKRIYDYFTENTNEFTAAYYVRQRMEGSLLSFSPAPMLRFIQKLAFGDQDPEVYKKKISEKIKELSSSRLSTESAVLAYKNKETELLGAISEREASLIEPEGVVTETEKTRAKEKISELDSAVKAAEKMISTINADIKTDAHAIRERFAYIKQDYDNADVLFNEKLPMLEAEYNDQMELLLEQDNIKPRQVILGEKARYFKWKESVNSFTDLMKKEFVDPPFAAPATQFLSDQIALIDSAVEESKEHYTKLIAEKQICIIGAKRHNCPKCGTKLDLGQNGLVVSSDQNDQCLHEEKLKALDELITGESALQKQLGTKKTKLVGFLSTANMLKSQAVKDPDPSIKTQEDLNNEITKLNESIEFIKTTQSKIDSITHQVNSLKSDLKARKAKLDAASIELEKCANILDLDVLHKQKEDIESRMDTYRNDIKSLSDIIVKYDLYQAKKAEYDLKVRYLQEKREEWLKISKQRIKIEEELDQTANKLAGMSRLKDISDAAAIGATESIINSINQYADLFINKLFPDGGTSVRILSGTKTQKGDDRSKLALSVIHKGQNVGKTISPLSGGEKDRLKMAFQLALSEIYRAHFMVVDEPFAGIDVENNMENCLSLLKEMSEKKLIIVAQHGAPEGIFDEIINI